MYTIMSQVEGHCATLEIIAVEYVSHYLITVLMDSDNLFIRRFWQ